MDSCWQVLGNLMSVVPLIIQNLEKNKKIKQILVTTSTTKFCKDFSKIKIKKKLSINIFQLDTNYILLTKIFKYWNP